MKSKGFTLIELLVVVAIISLLTSVVLASLGEVREKAKTAKFQEDIGQLMNALEIYKTNYGFYPKGATEDRWVFLKNSDGSTNSASSASFDLESELFNYIPKVPTPPTSSYIYYYLENKNNIRCEGTFSTPGYAILIHSTVNGFENYPFVEFYSSGGTDRLGNLISAGWSPNESYRCISL